MSLYPNAPGHRDVDTSVVAADALAPKLGRLQRIVLKAIEDAGEHGATSEELAEQLGLERYCAQPRTSELRRKGLVRDGGSRRRNASGKLAIAWVAS